MVQARHFYKQTKIIKKKEKITAWSVSKKCLSLEEELLPSYHQSQQIKQAKEKEITACLSVGVTGEQDVNSSLSPLFLHFATRLITGRE